jgi:hypothetical protein
MKTKDYKIVVSGDICITSLQWRTSHQNTKGLSWQDYPHVHNSLKTGEALLLSKLVALSTGANILSPQLENIDITSHREVLLSSVELERFPVTLESRQKVYRVKNFLGFTGPYSEIFPKLFPILKDDVNADMIILDDENNGFHSKEEFWPLAIKSPEKSPIVIYKINNPDSSTKLWNHIEKYHLKNTVVVINADDLRSKGVNISKGLSWERTALDFVWQMNNNPNLAFLAKCHHLIAPFGLEGAIYYRRNPVTESYLYFLTYELEGGFIKETQGKMFGLTSCFVAGLVRAIVLGIRNKEELSHSIDEGIREGMVAAQKYFIYGFGENPKEHTFPHPELFTERENDFITKEHIQDIFIRDSDSPGCQSWYIINDKSSASLAEIAYDIVKNGEENALRYIPIAQFGNLKTVDRTEIEGYRSIKNLMGEYVSAKNAVRPLSIAVFGTPGSGKSFGVAEVASSIAPGLIEQLNFNLSQFQTLLDLITAFHKVRDLSLEGKIPLVFFDEFDSAFERKLGWLKYFLAPMQDGVFREGDSVHPIGKAIFVFAGGTSSTFKEFCGEDIQDETEYKHFYKEFQSAKGPDFVSRLRGYVNILGPNQTDELQDQLFIVRRAMLLRSLLERKVPHLIDENGEAQIDNGVLRALLKVPRYKHESRSMEAILEMSMLSNARKWEQSHLPSQEQLKLHVDEEQFSRHLMLEAFFSEKIETLSKDLYCKQLTILNNCLQSDLNNSNLWEELSEETKNLIREQVKRIPSALLKIDYDVISVKDKPKPIEFIDEELRILGKYVNKRRQLNKKVDNPITPWDSLSSGSKTAIFESIKSWPEILADSHFKIERLKNVCKCGETHN